MIAAGRYYVEVLGSAYGPTATQLPVTLSKKRLLYPILSSASVSLENSKPVKFIVIPHRYISSAPYSHLTGSRGAPQPALYRFETPFDPDFMGIPK